MKKLVVLGMGVCLVLAFASCKSSESAYKKAYEKAKQQELAEPQVEAPVEVTLVDTPLRVTNVKPGMVETNFTVVRYRGDKEAADNFYKGIRPLTGDDIAETVYFAASAPAHIQIAEVLLMPTYQATGTISYKKKPE